MLRREDSSDIDVMFYQCIEYVPVLVAHYTCMVGEKSYSLIGK